MFRFKIYFEDYTIFSSNFSILEDCETAFNGLFNNSMLACNGGDIEEKIDGIGWVILNEANNDS